MACSYEDPSLIELDSSTKTRAVAFSANGEYLVGGHYEMVRSWRVADGANAATMAARRVNCLAVSKDGAWIVVGTKKDVVAWDATTHERVFRLEDDYVIGLDFSPDMTQLVTASSTNCTATIWDTATRQRVRTFRHDEQVRAAKYAHRGGRIATATPYSVQVWDSHDGNLLVDITAEVVPWYNTGLVWFDDDLLIISEDTIKQFDASTGSEISKWSVASANKASSIALPLHRQFIAYSADRIVTFWDATTRTQLGVIHHTEDICSIALSPDDRFIAIGGKNGKISIKSLSRIVNSIPLSRLHPTFREPDIQIDGAALDSWIHDQLANAEGLLTKAISTSLIPSHHILASRALVRARLCDWDAAVVDAKQSIEIHPSVIGYIANSVALIGKGENHMGYRACDIAFERFHSSHVTFLLLIKAVIVSMAGDHLDAISRLDDLIATVHFNSICYVVQAYMYLLLGNSQLEKRDYEGALRSYARASDQARCHTSQTLSVVSLISGWKFDDLSVTIQQHLCEALYIMGRVKDAGESLYKLVNSLDEEVYPSLAGWISNFTHRCLSTPSGNNDASSGGTTNSKVSASHPTIDSPTSTALLKEWAKATLTNLVWEDALATTDSFRISLFSIYRVVCERLEAIDRTMDASKCFHQMHNQLKGRINAHVEWVEWVLDFKRRFSKKLEALGDIATSTERHDDAISYYSAALTLDPATPQGLLVKRSKVRLACGTWEDALSDANQAIELDPLSPWGYERKHAALHEARDYGNAVIAFKVMLSMMSDSPVLEIRERYRQYINPDETRMSIRKAVQDAIRDSPRVLINTVSGRFLDKPGQTTTFESLPVFNELVSSMTTHIDHSRITRDVAQYYRYAMFSHRWETNEPLFEEVIHTVVYDLSKSPTRDKLKMFCKIVRDAGLHWAWSDTCCINKTDHIMIQEALVAMFRWYQGSSMTIIFLRGVCSSSRRGNLVKSVWNTRAWTLQEYHASKVVLFYNEDWTLYRDIDIPNHKESPEIIGEMEEATGVSTQTLMDLRPGLNDIRDKLRLASTRRTTQVEDAAYSLLGIFSLSLSVVYGEGDKSLGRLLAQLLTSSGDASILAWTGRSGQFNSCLPANIAVFNEPPTTHIPSSTEDTQMVGTSARSWASSLDVNLVMKLYDRLHDHVPSFSGQRLKLPCITFRLGRLRSSRSISERVFRADTAMLGSIEIRTKEDLSRLRSLYLIHPWIDYLLDRKLIGSVTEVGLGESPDSRFSLINQLPGSSDVTSMARQTQALSLLDRVRRRFGNRPRDPSPSVPPSSASSVDKQVQALRLLARLKQPFGALLLTQTRQNVPEFKRVATDSKIIVQVQENVSLATLTENVCFLDVL